MLSHRIWGQSENTRSACTNVPPVLNKHKDEKFIALYLLQTHGSCLHIPVGPVQLVDNNMTSCNKYLIHTDQVILICPIRIRDQERSS